MIFQNFKNPFGHSVDIVIFYLYVTAHTKMSNIAKNVKIELLLFSQSSNHTLQFNIWVKSLSEKLQKLGPELGTVFLVKAGRLL